MRKLIVLSFITLDGVMQAPGGPEEDKSGGFEFGGWSVNYWDSDLEKEMGAEMGHSFEMLLGRKTYDVFAAAWPQIDPKSPINATRKHVVTHRPIPQETEIWKNVTAIRENVADEIAKIKSQDGPELQVHGSDEIIQLLLEHDLVDELWLKIYPLTLGKGKKLFADGTMPAAWSLFESHISSKGVIIAKYKRNGKVQCGSFAS